MFAQTLFSELFNPSCELVKRMFASIKVRFTVRADNYNQNMIISTFSSVLLILLQPNLVRWYMCLVKTFDCCVQGQIHNKGSKFHLMFVQVISSEPLNLLNQI